VADTQLLSRRLQLAIDLQPKLRNSPVSPGFVRQDFESGLFLLHGQQEDDWLLEARTWGRPGDGTVRGWQILAADAAHALDPAVTDPNRP
jgi:hypothetical protein